MVMVWLHSVILEFEPFKSVIFEKDEKNHGRGFIL